MEGFCRGCLIKYNEPMELLQYTEKNRRLFVYSTGLQVKRNDSFTFQLCKDCFLNMKQACKFKKLCRTSDKRFRNYLALKDVGDPVDFCTFLKNSDETLTFRFPMTSGNSTPANQKCRDDDNESTCTIIRNFMTDILQGEEMPDTEARIIREVIEEEADVLDDSLDSHWLQDDMSIDTDFRLDFSFSPFSTPRTVNNDRCYTPKKYTEQKEEQVNFDTLNSKKQTKILNDFTNVFKNNENVKEFGFAREKIRSIEELENNDFKTVKEESGFNIDEIDGIHKTESNSIKINPNLKELCNFGLGEIEIIGKSENNTQHKELCDYSLDDIDSIEKSESSINKNNLSLKELCELSLNGFSDIAKSESSNFKTDQNVKELCAFDIPSIDEIDEVQKSNSSINKNNQCLKELRDFSLNGFDDIAKSEGSMFKNDQDLKELCAFSIPSISEIDDVEKPESNIDLPLLDVIDKEKTNIQDFYTPEDVIGSIQSNPEISNSSINIEALLKDKPCTIDRNLEEALKNTDNKEFSLDGLLVSPPVYQAASAASTPTITNILFGKKLDINPKIGQSIDTYDNVQCDIEIFEEFFQNDTKEFDLEDIKRVTIENKIGDKKDLSEVNDKENEENNIDDMDISVDDKNQANNIADSTTETKAIKHIISSTSDNEQFDLENSYCKLCKKIFKSVKSLSIHFAKVHKIKIVKPKLKLKRDNGNGPLCTNCGIRCRDRSNFARHMKQCGREVQVFKCNRCLEEFKSQAHLDKHMACHTRIYTKKNTGMEFVCPVCGVVMNRKGNYALHMRRHTKDYVTSCSVCGKGFYRQSELTSHMRQHTGDTPFSCKYCPRLFARKDALTRHVLIHLGEKLYECDYCGFKCLKKSDLKRHIQKKTCMKESGILADDKKEDIETPIQEQVTIIYAKGDNTAIKKQLPFIETELSN